MSYEVLARRWRPQTFDQVVGQSHVTTTLAHAIQANKLPHALLFAGPRGVGKTSIARILARSLNCEQGPSVKPCGQCSSCKGIAASTSLDVQEIDAASNNGVDDVREIRDSIRYSAAPGRHRIFIIDEVHMLSTQAFNALLKTLEEPPPNSLFIFATTDPQKIPVTVLSRVQRFDLKRLPAGDVLDLLRQICKSESLEVPETVLRALVREGDGSARDSLTLLDRLVTGLGTKIEEEAAVAVLDLVERRVLWQILDPVLAGDASAALLAVRQGIDQGIDPNRLAAELLGELRHLLVARISDQPEALIELAAEEVSELKKRAAELSPEAIQRWFRALLTRMQDMTFAPRPAHVLELAVVRLATLPDTRALSEVLRRLAALESTGTPAGGPDGGAPPSRGTSRRVNPSPGRDKPAAKRGSPPRSRAELDPASEPPPPESPPPGRVARTADPEMAAPETEAREAPPVREGSRVSDLARLRNEVKQNATVKDAIEILDAELRDVRTQGKP